MENKIRKRKVRSDKKREVRPHISTNHRLWVHRLSRILDKPEGDTGVMLVIEALTSSSCMEFFQSYFRRPYQLNRTTFFPANRQESLEVFLLIQGERDRFKMKFTQKQIANVEEFQYALGTPYLAHAVYALLKFALMDDDTIQTIAPHVEPGLIRRIPNLKMRADQKKRTISNQNGWSILK
ncbi:hypothetical protein JK635_08055 [Neobacillus sp. YIM B02564]|uniref:Uncharacterized protein n=1 Tax=Neobacillus paridis TaxID=2803862 RepID=A0ABS1TLG0_9BACI|nr:hypothetical protein [Neobacillus paridis]MBL4952164.1 hypothetical protein [Neobacillus paridis]